MQRGINYTLFALLLITLAWGGPALAQCPTPGTSQPAGVDLSSSSPSTFFWDHVSDAMYYRLEVTRNGKVFHREWFDGETSWTSDAALPGGDYTYWVRTWNPCGYGAWSTGFSFSVQCASQTPGPNYPNGKTYNLEYDDDFRFYRGNPSAAWFQIWIERNGSLYRRTWLPFLYGYGYAGMNEYRVEIDDVDPDLNGILPCGQYSWKVRTWADCYGMGDWSWSPDFTVNCCTGAPVKVDSIDMYEYWDYEAVVLDPRPYFRWDDNDDAPWYNVYLEKDGKPFANAWTEDAEWGKKGDLPPGDYAIAVRGWNKCGMGPWSDAFTFTVECSGPSQPDGLHTVFGYGYGYGFIDAAVAWNDLAGTYWYHLVVQRDGREVYNRWLDFSKPDHPIHYDYNIIAFPYALTLHGDYDYRVQAWNRCGMTPWSDWASYSIDCELTQPALLAPSGTIGERNPMLTWNYQDDVQQYRVYTSRNGKKWIDRNIESWESLAYDQGMEAGSFTAGGVAQGWQTDDGVFYLPLPFSFPFFGANRSYVYVDSNGTLNFGGWDSDYTESMKDLRQKAMIAVLWDDLITDGSNNPVEDIYIDTTVPNQVTIRWQAEYLDSNGSVNCAVTLYADGRIRLMYGSGNHSGGLIGLSSGDGRFIGDTYRHSMGNADDILFIPTGTPNAIGVSPEWDMPDGNYAWYVQPMSDCFGKGPWSAKGQFTIDGP